jgi:hypothetical protein
MATPPKRPTKKTTPPASPRLIPEAGLNPESVESLRKGVVALADRVNSLSTALATVNKIQAQVAHTERKAKENAERTSAIEEDMIPRSEHEERWKKEQAELIRTRLSIRRQTYLVGTAFFLLSILALGIVSVLIVRDIHARNTARCQSSNDFKRGDRELWNEVIHISAGKKQTPEQVRTTREFQAFLDKHDALQKC